ncbi:MAG: S1C family serine protease [Dehalococcoidia bacterium]
MKRQFIALPLLALGLLIAAVACGSGAGSDSDATTTPAVTPTPTETGSSLIGSTRDNASGETLTTVELVEQLRPSVVNIQTAGSAGTGFIIDREGHIVTNNHVIALNGRLASNITVTLSTGDDFVAEVVGRDPRTDIAVLKIDADDLVPVPLGSSSDLRVGEDVLAMGNALALEGGPTVTTGVVSALGRVIQNDDPRNFINISDAIQTDAIINPGNSGGPLVNARGEVIGITSVVIRGNQAEGIGLAISIDSAKPIIQELKDSGSIDRGILGVTIESVDRALAAGCFPLSAKSGVLIVLVQQGGPADEAGLLPCDVIVQIEDTTIDTFGDLFDVLNDYRAGVTVDVEIVRRGERETTEITLG